MKKFFTLLLICLFTTSCFEKETPQTEKQETNVNTSKETGIENKKFSFKRETLTEGCTEESQILCQINLVLKCTIDPQFKECAAAKDNMPGFIFMVDDSLDRPSDVSYQVTKLKPLEGTAVEVYTKSSCNGNWFGLCNGTIIYIVDYGTKGWFVKDIYARAD